MKIAVLMDPLSSLSPEKDTSLHLIQRAQYLGHETWYFTPEDWWWEENRLMASMIPLFHEETWITKPAVMQSLLEMDVILMRQNPPVNTQYLYATYALSEAEKAGVMVSNRPSGVRETNEKFAITQFKGIIPTTLITQNRALLRTFWEKHHDIVLKPLDGRAGMRVFHVDNTGANLAVILDVLTQDGQQTIMAQTYIPEIKTSGDKRILLIHGEPVPFAYARIPSKTDWRGNLAAGASGRVVPLNEQDRRICEAVKPYVKSQGLHLVGLDVIGAYLTEINVTSPTCMVELSKETGLDLALDFWKSF